jgi:hypothetical protein
MIDRLMSAASRVALTAAAGFLATQAWGADLGGNCCVDLEERVAELEATTARKGTRKMGLSLYGQVSETILFWDDGAERNVYVVENNAFKNKFGAMGSAKIAGDWSAGFKLEWQVRAFRSSAVNQLARGDNEGVTSTVYNTRSLSLRWAQWYLRSDTYGTIGIGQQEDAAEGVAYINLANPDGFAAPNGGYANAGFFLRRAGTVGNAGLSALTWNNAAFFRNGDGPNILDYIRATSVRYTSPTLHGFTLSASWGEDDFWSLALRYGNEFNGVRIAWGIAYSDWRDDDKTQCTNLAGPNTTSTETAVSCHSVQAGASVMHVATGLYASGGWGQITDNNRQVGAVLSGLARTIDDTDDYWWVQAGWEARLNALGKTTFWADFERWDNGLIIVNNAPQTLGAGDPLNSLGGTPFILGSRSESWGLGVTQAIDAAGMNLYVGFKNFSTDLTLATSAATRRSNPIDDFQLVYSGATVKF